MFTNNSNKQSVFSCIRAGNASPNANPRFARKPYDLSPDPGQQPSGTTRQGRLAPPIRSSITRYSNGRATPPVEPSLRGPESPHGEPMPEREGHALIARTRPLAYTSQQNRLCSIRRALGQGSTEQKSAAMLLILHSYVFFAIVSHMDRGRRILIETRVYSYYLIALSPSGAGLVL